MKIFCGILLGCLLASLVVGRGLTYADLQKQLLEQFTSPFVNLMFVYDGSTESNDEDI
jgi:hypothetical protein